jgi:hypothetical protein
LRWLEQSIHKSSPGESKRKFFRRFRRKFVVRVMRFDRLIQWDKAEADDEDQYAPAPRISRLTERM